MITRPITRPIRRAINRSISRSSGVTPVTDGMTLTAAWATRGTAYSTLSGATAASVRVDAVIDNTDSGMLMESGAGGTGLVLYVYAGVLYFQCGNGQAVGTSADRAETSYILPTGEASYVIEWSADTDNSVLYVNGDIADSQSFSFGAISGGNEGTVGRVAGDAAVNRGGWTADGSGDYTNTITRCDIFLNQVTSDV